MIYFKDEDFKCKCSANNGAGCGMDVTDEVKEMADKIRATAGIPLSVNSGARCKAHNKAIRASETSSHTLGLAVDFKCSESFPRYKLIKALMELGITRIGLHKAFIHFDLDKSKASSVWFY